MNIVILLIFSIVYLAKHRQTWNETNTRKFEIPAFTFQNYTWLLLFKLIEVFGHVKYEETFFRDFWEYLYRNWRTNTIN